MSGTVHPEVEIPRPEAREELDVGESTVRVAGPVEDQPVPTFRVGGSSSSGTRAGSGSRANEANIDDRETKRVRLTESRGLKRQGEDVAEMVAKAEEQHLDADVEVPAHKTGRVEDVVGDAEDAAPEQMNTLLDAREQSMNSFVQSKTEVFEKIEVWSKISTMTRSWGCAYPRKGRMRARPQQFSVRRSLRQSERGLESVTVLQWI